jgi:hypothetical protein
MVVSPPIRLLSSTKLQGFFGKEAAVDIVVFYDCDQFAVQFEPRWRGRLLGDGRPHCNRPRGLWLSEVMTIMVMFHGVLV